MPGTTILQQIVRSRRGLIVGLAVALFCGIAHAFPSVDWSLSLHAGYDDQVYADPEETGILEPVSTIFGTTRSRLLLRYDGLGQDGDRLDLAGEGSWTTYGDDVSGDDHGFAGSARYSRWLAERWILDANLSALRYRREMLALFDLDQVEVGGRISRAGLGRWLLGLAVRHRWPFYRGRYLSAESDRTEEDRQFDISGSALREVGEDGFVSLEIGGRWNRSNNPLVEYRGPIATGRWGFGRSEWMALASYASVGRRAYDSYPVLEPRGEEWIDTGKRRTDTTWGVGIAVERLLGRTVKAFADVGLLHQSSNIDALAFDQTRVSVGLQFLAFSKRGTGRLGLPTATALNVDGRDTTGGSLAPRWAGGEVLFRHRAPDAKSVSVVGGWNAWNPERSPMRGPDSSGIWEATIEVPIGVWRYAIVVDGEWVRPYAATRYEDDGFGGTVGILEVAGETVR